MKEKKNIDRLFQEKFKNFEAQPSDQVWANIVAAQKEKDDRKVVPLWWKVGGIAAALAILLGLGNLIAVSTSTENDANIVEQNAQEKTIDQSSKDDSFKNIDEEAIVISNDNSIHEEDDATLTTLNSSKASSSHTGASSNSNLQKTKVVAASGTTISTYNNDNTTFTQNEQAGSSSSRETQATNNKGLVAHGADSSSNDLNTTTKESSTLGDNPKTATIKKDPLNTVQEETAIAGQTTEETLKKDLVAEANKIKEELNKEEAAALQENLSPRNRWDVGAIAAPVYYSDFGGSGLDDRFADNDKSGDVNLSYGVQVSYAVTPKFKIRTGVSNLDLSYNTNEIQFSTSGLGRRVQGLDFSDNVTALAISDNSNPRASNNPTNSLLPVDFDNKQDGSLIQQLNYLEVPVEAVYIVSDKRLGLSVVGGVSTLFLNDNDVILESAEVTTNLGTATGANEVSFTTNFGIGVDYKMTDKLKLNIEPSLKYQLNSFDESVGDFKPYFLGVYTGVSYKF